MAEVLTLTTPIVPPTVTTWRVTYVSFDWTGAMITIALVGSGGEAKSHSYSGATATTLMTQLNKVNLATNSLQKRILDRLVTDGVLAGTVSGTPD